MEINNNNIVVFITIQEEWRIKMPPIQCLFINVYPTADVRLTFKSNGQDYPPNIPHHVTKILELHFVSMNYNSN